jgi:hypothetical protein
MSATALVLLLCALACPVGMGLMMLFMRKGHGDSHREHTDRRAEAENDRAE